MVASYQILEVLGRGGSGWVARARGPDGRDVALKMIVATGDGTRSDSRGAALQRFMREARLQGGLTEADGFVPLIDSGVTPQGAFLVMPLLTGGTLRDRIMVGRMEIAAAVKIVRQIAAALGKAHERGIVHRDMKPDNVIFAEPGGRPLVADLGLAKHFRKDVAGASQSIGLSATGAFLGTASYMAPEQFIDAKTVEAGADVFSLGAILYECLSGKVAFDGEGLVDVMTKIANVQYEPIERVRPQTPPWLASVVRRALEGDPARRYANGAELAAALNAGPKGAAASAGASRTQLAAGLAAALVVLLGLGYAVFRAPAEHPEASASPTTPSPGAQDPAAPPAAGTAAPPPAATAPPPAAPKLPAFCASIPKTAHTECTACFGGVERRHGAMVAQVDFSEDGKLAVSSSLDQTIRVWDTATDREVATFFAGEDVFPVRFLDGGRTVVSGGTNAAIRFWDVATGRETGKIPVDQTTIFGLWPSPDGKLLLASSGTGPLRVFDVASRSPVSSFSGHKGQTGDAAFFPSSTTIVSGGVDGTLRFWRASDGTETQRIESTPDKVGSIALSADGKRVATGGMSRCITLYDVATGEEIRTLTGHGEGLDPRADGRVTGLAFSPDGKRLLSSSRDGTLRLWDVEMGTALRTMSGHWTWVMGSALSPDGTRALSGGNDQTVRLWDVATGREVRPLADNRNRVHFAELSDGGRAALSLTVDGTLAFWDGTSGREVVSTTANGKYEQAGISPDGRLGLLVAGSEPTVVDATTGGVLATLRGHQGAITGWAFTRDGERIVTSSLDGTVRVWKARTGVEEKQYDLGMEPTRLGVLDARTVYIGGKDGVIREWDLEAKTPLARFEGKGAVLALQLSPDGKELLSIHPGPEFVMWDLASHAARSRWKLGHTDHFKSLDVSPGLRLVALLTTEGTLRLLDSDTGEPWDEIDIPPALGSISSLAFSTDGRSLAVGLTRGPVLRFTLSARPSPR
jgi:WD40 repeat protein